MIKKSDVKWIKGITDLENSIIQYQPYFEKEREIRRLKEKIYPKELHIILLPDCEELDNFNVEWIYPEWKRILALHRLESQFKNAIEEFNEDQKNHWVYKYREVFFLNYDIFIDCLDKADENRFCHEGLKIDISLQEFKHYTEFSYLYNKKCSDSEFCRYYDEILK